MLLVLLAAPAAVADPRLEPLERLWTEHMLGGSEGRYAYGKRIDYYRSTKGYTWARGGVLAASGTNRGISVSDLSETQFLGPIQGGGWTLHGGLLARVDLNEDFLELYGLNVVRWRGGLLGFGIHHEEEDVTYDFFLLHRPGGAARATVIQKWSIPTGDIDWTRKQPLLHEIVRGFLTYDAATKTAVVTITGLRRAHEYSVDAATVVPTP